MTEMPTRDRILDAAEELFADKGLDATSLREITQAAGANLASVNYYFRSKDELILAVYARRIEPINAERMKLLRALDRDAPVEDVIAAFVTPMVSGLPKKQLISRMYFERSDLLAILFETHFRKPVDAFLKALAQRLPDVPRQVLAMRIHFLMGSTVHAMTRPEFLGKLSVSQGRMEELVEHLIAFAAAGLRAKLPAREAIHA
jgi:AcrR family transcriptional regulator